MFWNSFMLCVLIRMFFYCWVVFYLMNTPQFVYLFTYWWQFRLAPLFDYYKWSCYEYSCICLYADMCFHFSWVAIWCDMVILFTKLPNCFSKLFHVTLLPAVYERVAFVPHDFQHLVWSVFILESNKVCNDTLLWF